MMPIHSRVATYAAMKSGLKVIPISQCSTNDRCSNLCRDEKRTERLPAPTFILDDKSVATYAAMKSGLKAGKQVYRIWTLEGVATYAAMKSGLKAVQWREMVLILS